MTSGVRRRRRGRTIGGYILLAAIATVCFIFLWNWLMCEPMPQTVPSRSLKI